MYPRVLCFFDSKHCHCPLDLVPTLVSSLSAPYMAFRLPNLWISPSLARRVFFWVRLKQGVNPCEGLTSLLNQLFKQPSSRDVTGEETDNGVEI